MMIYILVSNCKKGQGERIDNERIMQKDATAFLPFKFIKGYPYSKTLLQYR